MPDRGLSAGRPMAPVPTPTATATEGATTGLEQTAATGATVTIQYDSPSVTSVNNTEAALRGTPGVKSAVTTSLALGGISVMRVGFDADPAVLRADSRHAAGSCWRRYDAADPTTAAAA